MNLLLDTHIWLWWLADSERLPAAYRDAINSPDSRVFVSAISLWEVHLKRQSGRLITEGDIVAASADMGLEFLAFTVGHANIIDSLPGIHGDPFDRALIAQAIGERSILMTVDEKIMRYPKVQLFGAAEKQ